MRRSSVYWLDLALALILGPGPLGFQQNPFKTIGPPGKPEGNTIHRV
jgi:hypothetical protein